MGDMADFQIEIEEGLHPDFDYSGAYIGNHNSDDYERIKAEKKIKTAKKLERSIRELKSNNIEYKVLSEYHYRIGDFDFWPSSFKWWNRKTGERGAYIEQFIKMYKLSKNQKGSL